ncbi:MAG: S-adenosylmethionine:tRNA ribosyltransferase-isomerase, partial [Chloroflexota bacterium]
RDDQDHSGRPTSQNGYVYGSTGWTDLVISPERGLNVIDGLLTGFHEPEATHIAMLAALSGLDHLDVTYRSALNEGYLWHEFGDLHLLLPSL